MKRSITLRALCLGGLLPLLFAAPLPAQAKGKKVALLVGVTEYDSAKFPALKYTGNDVVELAKILKARAGFDDVRVLTSAGGKALAPTAANIRKALREVTASRKRADTVVVALSGHGIQLDVPDPDEKGKPKTYSYFCPLDSDLGGVSYSTGRSKTLINVKEVFDALDDCGAGTKLVLMDACRNELQAESSTRSLDARKFTIPEGVGALFSCSAGQRAFEAKKLEHGVFFHRVLKGLRGEAKNKKGEITWSSLTEYVTEKVEEDVDELIGGGAKQTPHPFNNLPGRSPVLVPAQKEEVVKGGKGPAEVFDAFQAAVRKKDWKTAFALVTPESQDRVSIHQLTRYRINLITDKPAGAEGSLAAILQRHGLKLDKGEEGFARLNEANKSPAARRTFLSPVKDVLGLIHDLFTALDKYWPEEKPIPPAKVKDVKVSGDTASGVLEVDGSETSEKLTFRRIRGEWKVEVPEPGAKSKG